MKAKRGTAITAIKTRVGIKMIRVERRAVRPKGVVQNAAPGSIAAFSRKPLLGPIAADLERILRHPHAFPKALV